MGDSQRGSTLPRAGFSPGSSLPQLQEALAAAIGALGLSGDHAGGPLVAAMEQIDELTTAFSDDIGRAVAEVRLEVAAERERTVVQVEASKSLLEAAAESLAREKAAQDAAQQAEAAELARGWEQLHKAQAMDRQERAAINARWQLLQQQPVAAATPSNTFDGGSQKSSKVQPLTQTNEASLLELKRPAGWDPYAVIAGFLQNGDITIPEDPAARAELRREATATGLGEVVALLDAGEKGRIGCDACSEPSSVLLRGTALLAIGGMLNKDMALDAVDMLNLETGSWQEAVPMSTRRAYLSAATSLDHPGFIYALGGSDGPRVLDSVEELNLSAGQWRALPSLVKRRVWAASAIARGSLLAVGGYDGKDYLSSVEHFPISTYQQGQQWTSVAPLPGGPRSALGGAALRGIVYAVGGFRAPDYLATCEAFDIRSNQWWGVPSLQAPRRDLGVAALDGMVLVAGGYDGQRYLATCEGFDPRTSCWRSLASLQIPRHLLGVAAVGSLVYAAGGYDGTTTLRVVEVYETRMDLWRTTSLMPRGRLGLALAAQ